MKQLLQSKSLQIIGLSIMFIFVIYLVYLDYKKMHKIIDKSHIEKTFKVFVPIKEDENTIFMETARNYLTLNQKLTIRKNFMFFQKVSISYILDLHSLI